RARELVTIHRLISDPQVRLITILGPGGIGKTRFAIEAARTQTDFSDGMFFVSLAPVATAVEIIPTIAAAVDFHFHSVGREKEQLINYLRHKKMLLIMDNFEHLLDGRLLLAEIIEEAAALKLLVTSRERLQLQSEQLFTLEGLTLPSDEAFTLQVEANKEKVDYAAAQLFLNIARRTLPDYDLLPGDTEQIYSICHLVGGMPLGLELAASWVGMLSLSDIATEIEQNLQLLNSRQKDRPQRHSSMQASLDASWCRISVEQQHALQGLALFQGGFTRPAAMQAVGASLPILVTLVNKSWLTYNRQQDRYYIHELLRQYSAQQLALTPDTEAALRHRHAAYYCGLLHARAADWYSPRQKKAAAEIRVEIDNILAAWRWMTANCAVDLIAQGLDSLCRYFEWDGRLSEGRNVCQMAAQTVSQSIPVGGDDKPARLALWSKILSWASSFVAEKHHQKEILAHSQKLLDQVLATDYDARREMAFLLQKKTNAAENKRLGLQALKLFQELDDVPNIAEMYLLLGSIDFDLGDYSSANEYLRQSLAICKKLGDMQGIAITNVMLGLVAWHQGHLEKAVTLGAESLNLFRRLENRYNEGWNLGLHAYNLIWNGQFEEANRAAEQALTLDRYLGTYPNPWRVSAFILSEIHLGNYAQAMSMGKEMVTHFRQLERRDDVAWQLIQVGDIALAVGEYEEARRFLHESADVFAQVRDSYRSLPLISLSFVERMAGQFQLAQQILLRGLNSALEYRLLPAIIKSLPVAALLMVDAGYAERAVELYGVAKQFNHVNDSQWFADVACRELDAVYASLPQDVTETAVTRGRELDVWATAESLLQELDGRFTPPPPKQSRILRPN
ncbi:MAG: tetratricopeptide repeat protein, partial [Anaerolineales bacterium]|nr:tetratricopeptide repeat protein [Anaerolineales bacterium]